MKISYKCSVFILVLCAVSLSVYFSIVHFYQKKENFDMETIKNTLTEGAPIDIADVSSPAELKTEESGDVFFYNGQIKRQVVYQNNPISNLVFSPQQDRFGYLVNYSIYDENISYDREVALRIEDLNTRESKQFFHDTFRTSDWEWFSNDEILVSEGCGTECQVEFLIDLKSGKEYVLQYGVGYTWSPDKKWVFAYNYSYRTGITVGDKFGNIVYKHHIIPPENETANTPLAVWSPDSSKLALIIENLNDKNFEISVFDSREKFKKIFQSKIEDEKEFELKWTSNSKSVEVNNKSYHF